MNPKWRSFFIAVAIATAYALLLRIFFGMEILHNFAAVMTLSFFITVPFAIGYLTVMFSSAGAARSLPYRIFAPWLPVAVLLVITMALAIEGWMCWLMILPIFLVFASIGGLVAGSRKMRKQDRRDKLQLSVIALLPFVLCPLEKQLPVLDGTYALEKLGYNDYRLHLYSHFTFKTTFNGYAAWWGGMIMKDIQRNILQIIKTRCEVNL